MQSALYPSLGHSETVPLMVQEAQFPGSVLCCPCSLWYSRAQGNRPCWKASPDALPHCAAVSATQSQPLQTPWEHQRVPWQPVLVCRVGSRKLAGGWLKKLRRMEASDTEIFYTSGFLCKSCNPCAPSWPRERTFQCWAMLGLVAHSVPLVSLSIPEREGKELQQSHVRLPVWADLPSSQGARQEQWDMVTAFRFIP